MKPRHAPRTAPLIASLVVAIAKRARQISEEAEEKGEIITVKPVQLAIDEFVKGQYKLIEKENIGQEIE